MKLIIWLWNPWEQYEKTRHNTWFLFLDYLREKEKFPEFKEESKFKWKISTWILKWEKTIFLKPQTFMNLSWESINKVMNFYKINLEDIIVIYDDISMDFWKIKFREKWNAGWHNGIKDIIKYLWITFNRIKIWIWFNEKYEVSDWVLSKFNNEKFNELNESFEEVYKILIKKIKL
jgi:PTH1 family peptidyl-tRNA hydrolase